MYPFLVDEKYSRKDVYKIIGIPEDTKGGNWDTGYNKHNSDYFIFTNIETSGRTGHDYGNKFIGNNLYWFAKTHTKISQPQIQELLNPPGYVYIFYREDNTKPFIFAGTARPISSKDETPVQITWEIFNSFDNEPLSQKEVGRLPEGQKKQIISNAYERNPEARQRCVEHYGYKCVICQFDFVKFYGDLGKDFIHVHHVKPISEIGEEYCVDPIKDLLPVCPNCHAMMHRRKPCCSPEEVREVIINNFSK
jgi:5-methylcytosine-specific restriction protein A